MTDKVALKILEMEKDKLMLEPEATRDWELITALDIAIEALKTLDNNTLVLDEKASEILMDIIEKEADK